MHYLGTRLYRSLGVLSIMCRPVQDLIRFTHDLGFWSFRARFCRGFGDAEAPVFRNCALKEYQVTGPIKGDHNGTINGTTPCPKTVHNETTNEQDVISIGDA